MTIWGLSGEEWAEIIRRMAEQMKRYEYRVPNLVCEEKYVTSLDAYGRPNWTVPGDMRPISVEVIYAPRGFFRKEDFLLKGEEEGAQTTEQQMRDAAEIAATEKALMDAGYTRKADGTFENRWFTARVGGDVEEGVVPRQRKVSYTPRGKF